MPTHRYYTLDEANRTVPLLAGAFGRILRLRALLRAAGGELEKLGQPTDPKSLTRVDGPETVRAVRARARGLYETLAEEIEGLHGRGIEIKDLDTGLCDFYALRDGREVYLCWRFGEPAVLFWHELHTGFAGRLPVDAAFLAPPGPDWDQDQDRDRE